ncbi:MOSC domain-containing protein [Ahniella affigens]|uniref:MOSC domain-containing protein n=1 Tax=Ahniella affigens TaxID=2021234 RepID=A0A2P1PUB0_9GAMM|nr:MOSC N-terminal beta barrel domain-containing protein [Ahniella affigens]AVP98427.1 MOSC domain-containing protein [Ahniella affigens]
MRLLEIYRHPVKSFGGELLDAAELHDLGVKGDRRFMLIDANDRFVSAREVPALLHWRAHWHDDGSLLLVAPNGASHRAQLGADTLDVTVWDDTFQALLCAADTQAWLGTHLDWPARLVFVPDPSPRAVDPQYAQAGDAVSFADGYPILIVSDASLDELQARAGLALSMRRFRPNLVISATAPHAEDQWRRLRIGECELELVKPCVRCVLTTIDPITAEPHPEREPLRSLIQYRRGPKGVTFGMNALVRRGGLIRIDDPIEPLA